MFPVLFHGPVAEATSSGVVREGFEERSQQLGDVGERYVGAQEPGETVTSWRATDEDVVVLLGAPDDAEFSGVRTRAAAPP